MSLSGKSSCVLDGYYRGSPPSVHGMGGWRWGSHTARPVHALVEADDGPCFGPGVVSRDRRLSDRIVYFPSLSRRHGGLSLSCLRSMLGRRPRRQMRPIQPVYGPMGESLPGKRCRGGGQQRTPISRVTRDRAGWCGCSQQDEHLPAVSLRLPGHLRRAGLHPTSCVQPDGPGVHV